MPCRLTRDIALLVVHTMQTDDDDVEVQDGSAQCCLLTCPPSYSDTRTSPERQRAAVPRVFHCPRPASRLGLRGFGVCDGIAVTCLSVGGCSVTSSCIAMRAEFFFRRPPRATAFSCKLRCANWSSFRKNSFLDAAEYRATAFTCPLLNDAPLPVFSVPKEEGRHSGYRRAESG